MKFKMLTLFLLIFLTGCTMNGIGDNNHGNDGKTSSAFLLYKELDVIDESETYIINEEMLELYYYEELSSIYYVEVNQFIDIFSESFVDFYVTEKDEYVIDFEVADNITFQIILNERHNTIEISDIAIFNMMYTETESDYETDMEVVSGSYIPGNSGEVIYLDDYNMSIVRENDDLYLPFYLANLLLTGDRLIAYPTIESVYVYEDISDLNEGAEDEELLPFNFEEMKLHTSDYLSLYFDHFYGLNEEKSRYRWYREMNTFFNFTETETTQELNQQISQFLFKLDDLHTGLVFHGYGENPDKTPVVIDSSLIWEYSEAYYNHGCNLKHDEVTLTEMENLYVLEINSFTLDTKDLLHDKLQNLKDIPIIIDLSCNPGGYVAGALEVIPYLTDDIFPVTYSIGESGDVFQEHTTNQVVSALSNTVYFYTSRATYSAANELTSIVKDSELAPIFGGITGGGSAAVTYTLLPNNTLITSSSNFIFRNSDGESIEFGVEPNHELNNVRPFDNILKSMGYLYLREATRETQNHSLGNEFYLKFDIEQSYDDVTFIKYKIKILDIEDSSLIFEEHITTEDFLLERLIDTENEVYKVEVYVVFMKGNLKYEALIYDEVIDDYPNYSAEFLPVYQTNQEIKAYSHEYFDQDVFKINIPVDGNYQILLNGEPVGRYDVDVYDLSGNIIEYGSEFYLEQGVHDLECYTGLDGGYYTIEVVEVIEE